MTLAYTFALLSTLLGTALGLLGGHGRVSGPLRSFAFVAAIAVVFGQLLPEALSEGGLSVIAVFAAGVLVPRLMFHHHHGPGHGHGLTHGPDLFDDDGAHIRAGLWLSLVAMMLHQMGDGVALGAFASGAHAEHLHVDLFFAIAAHTVPVVGLLVHAFVQQWGRTTASLQGLALGLSGVLGVALADAINASAAVAWTPFITAFAAGLLIHVVSHDRPATESRDRFARVMDVLAVVAGVALVSQGGHAHGEYEGAAHVDMAASVSQALLELSLATAPALLLGLLLGAALQSLGRGIPRAWLSGGGPLRQALRGALAGGPLPVCSCAVLPVAHAIRSRGGSAAFVIAFLLATPELGIESLVLTGRFLGWQLALVRLLGAIVVAAGAAYVAGRVLASREQLRPTPQADFELGGPNSRFQRGLGQLDELFVHILPFTMVGLLAAAYAESALDAGALSGLASGSLDILLVTLVSMPVYVCAASATPLAAVLIAKGLSPGAALVGLLLGPATNLATLGFMRASFGARATWAATLCAVGLAWALAGAVNAFGVHQVPAPLTHAAHAHGTAAHVCLAVLVAWVLRTVYVHGVSALFDGLKVTRFDAAHGHAHGHEGAIGPADAHEHAHGHGTHGHGHGEHGHGAHGEHGHGPGAHGHGAHDHHH
ncbi:MAG: permease [Sandaracinaceae bacterium]|nr:permease [Sandaracinaceae bacterium]